MKRDRWRVTACLPEGFTRELRVRLAVKPIVYTERMRKLCRNDSCDDCRMGLAGPPQSTLKRNRRPCPITTGAPATNTTPRRARTGTGASATTTSIATATATTTAATSGAMTIAARARDVTIEDRAGRGAAPKDLALHAKLCALIRRLRRDGEPAQFLVTPSAA